MRDERDVDEWLTAVDAGEFDTLADDKGLPGPQVTLVHTSTPSPTVLRMSVNANQ